MAAAERYALPARVLHWGVAVLVVAMLVLGVAMTRLDLSLERMFALYQWHKAIGVVLWVVMIGRLGVRLRVHPPAWPDWISPARQRAARMVHVSLYGVLLVLPVTGWLMVSASPFAFPIVLFGVEVPMLGALQALPDAARQRWFDGLKAAHSMLVFLLLGLMAVHVAGAVRHGARLRGRM